MGSKLLTPLFMVLIMVTMTYSAFTGSSEDEVVKIIASDDIVGKLNYIIESRQQQSAGRVLYPMLGIIGLFFVVLFSGSFFDKVFPRNIFCWGKAASAHYSLVRVREKWLWGVAIAFVISVLATFASDGFKRFIS